MAAYVGPLRSAILVDDAFPRYDQLVEIADRGEGPSGPESSTAARVISMFHHRGLICDIENRAKELLTTEQLARITKSDLVVLDYHLTPGSDSDVLPALSILESLAESHHANLVVVYTKHDLNAALQDVFVRFRGIDQQAAFPEQYEADLTGWLPELDRDALFRYLEDSRQLKPLIKESADKLNDLGIPPKDHHLVVRAGVELWLQQYGFRHVNAPDRADATGITRSSDGSGTPWLHYHNVFIAFASKQDPEADLLEKLEAALVAWNPGVLRMILSYARNRMQQRGFAYEKIVVGGSERQIGLLYHALESEEPEETVRLRDMLRRLFESVRRELAADSAAFGASLIKRRIASATDPPSQRDERTRFFIDQARAMADIDSKAVVDAEHVIASLNAFLCSREFDGSHLWAGTVFRDEQSKKWWVCAAPTCEIVPRPPTAGTWQWDLYPSLPMLALRLEPAKTIAALSEATQAKHIFVNGPKGVVALRISDPISGQPRPETLILQGEGRVDSSGTFKAFAIVKGKSAVPKLESRTFRIVAQLRSEYADRFLHQTGQHTSRIGVDFVALG